MKCWHDCCRRRALKRLQSAKQKRSCGKGKAEVKDENEEKGSNEPPMKRLRTKSSCYPAVTIELFHHGYHMLIVNTAGFVFLFMFFSLQSHKLHLELKLSYTQ